jgi:TonB family protein
MIAVDNGVFSGETSVVRLFLPLTSSPTWLDANWLHAGWFDSNFLMLTPEETRACRPGCRDPERGGNVAESHHEPLPGPFRVSPMKALQTEIELQDARPEPKRDQHQSYLGNLRRQHQTTATTLGVIAISLLLGWMIGRAGWNAAVDRAEKQMPPTVAEQQHSTPDPGDGQPATAVAEPIQPAKEISSTAVTPANTALKSSPKKLEASGNLVMYDHGKVLFRSVAPSDVTSLVAGHGVVPQIEPPPAANSKLRTAADGYLIDKVLPKYPEDAKQQRAEGPVELNAVVGTDGRVREVEVVSGNPQLIPAATEAVRQWRFKPHQQKGKPAEFETRITVNFSLPQ